MSCQNCDDINDSSCTDITSSTCVSWQGDKVEELQICVNNSLTYVGNVILSKIKDLLKGKGIVLTDLDLSDSEYLETLLGLEEKNLLNVLNTYKQAIESLKSTETITSASLSDFTNAAGYTLGCIASADPCGDPLTFKTLIQNIITKVCALNTQYSTIGAAMLDIVQEVAGNFLVGGAIRSCGDNGIVVSGVGASAVVTFQALVPPSCPIIYTGSLSFFDSKGIGLPNTAYCGWYLCNGANGTPNSTTLPQNAGNNIQYIIRFK